MSHQKHSVIMPSRSVQYDLKSTSLDGGDVGIWGGEMDFCKCA